MTQFSKRNNQRGMALLAAVLIITVFAIIGMMSAKRAKESEKIAGGNSRYQVVFQAAEISLRNAVEYINKANGDIVSGYAGSGSEGKKAAANFDMSKLSANKLNILYSPENTIVWDKEILKKEVCQSNPCPGGIDFNARMDQDFWKTHGIKSKFISNSDKNHIRNTETYVFIELLQEGVNGGGVPATVGDKKLGSSGSSTGAKETFYLITVKASGFPPDTKVDSRIPLNSRENVIIQAVFAKRA